MADFNQTITNSVRVFGGEAATKWGSALGPPYSMVWGTTLWGEGSYTIQFNIGKLISESTAFSGDNTYSVGYFRTITNNLPATATFTIENLSDSNGWKYVFTSDTTNAADRDFATYTTSTVYDATFTCAAVGATTWTEL